MTRKVKWDLVWGSLEVQVQGDQSWMGGTKKAGVEPILYMTQTAEEEHTCVPECVYYAQVHVSTVSTWHSIYKCMHPCTKVRTYML